MNYDPRQLNPPGTHVTQCQLDDDAITEVYDTCVAFIEGLWHFYDEEKTVLLRMVEGLENGGSERTKAAARVFRESIRQIGSGLSSGEVTANRMGTE